MKKEDTTAEQPMRGALTTPKRKFDALSLKIANRILSGNPGLTPEYARKVTDTLMEADISPLQAAVIMDAVYRPTSGKGTGQTTRGKWFVQALTTRWAGRLEKAATSLASFRTLVAEIEELNEFRDRVNAEGTCSLSYQQAMMLDECGIGADAFMVMMYDSNLGSPFAAKAKIMRAVRLVISGQAATVEGALAFEPRGSRDE